MFFKGAITGLISYLMRKAPLPVDLHAKLQEQNLPTSSNVTLVVPGSGIVMAALADALAKANGLKIRAEKENNSGRSHLLPYAGTPIPVGEIQFSWLDWNDQVTLSKLITHESPHVLVSVEIFERRGPSRSNPRYRFGVFRSLEFLIFRRRSAIMFGTPLVVEAAAELSVSRVVRLLKVERSRSLRLVRGVQFQSQRLQEDQVLSGPEYERELGLLSQKLRVSREQAQSLTRKEFRTISANPVRWLFTVCAAIARWIIRELFSEVTVVGMNQFIDASRDAAVVLVPMHRSHLDYILVGSVLYESRLNTPLVAAGLNLSFWPVGPMIRSLGAYFVKRNARNDRVHSLVLKRYVSYLTKRGHLQEFFIEGGRSRSGRMRSPKLGLLNVMVDACVKGLRRELLFIPVSISYENVVEERSLAEENTGIKKKSESLRDLLSLHRVFRRNYGEVVLQFGRPLSLSNMLNRVMQDGAVQSETTKPRSTKIKPDTRTVVKELANALTTRLRSQSSISLSGLICTALLSAPRYGLSIKELGSRLLILARIARLARVQNAELGAFTHTLELFLERPEALRSVAKARSTLFHVRKVIHDEIVYIPGAQRYRADFYRNSSQHVFFPLAVAAAAQRLSSAPLLETIGLLHSAFEREFLLGTRDEFTQAVVGMLEILASEGLARKSGIDESWLIDDSIMELGLDSLVLVSIESMLWLGERLAALRCEPGTSLIYKDFVFSAQEEFRPAAYRTSGIPSRTEAGSQSNLAGALEMLESLEIVEIQEGAAGPTNIVVRSTDLSVLRRYELLAETIRDGAQSNLLKKFPTSALKGTPKVG